MNLKPPLRLSLQYRWLVFFAIALGMFASVLDQTSVNLALPSIARHFSASIPEVQWVALGYILTTGSLLLPMGRLSDIVGRKRVYLAGYAIFVVGAVLTGLAPSLTAVVLFKVFQGIGAAMIQATSMAIVTSVFPANERGKAIGSFMTMIGLGAIAGPIVGGAVVSLLGWRFVFFMGLPIGIFSVVASVIIVKEAGDFLSSRRKPRFDFPGAVLSAMALVLFLLVMTNAYRVGWGSPLVAGGFVVVVLLFAAFIWWERRSPEPMLAFELFQRRLFSTASSANFLTFLSATSVFFLMPFYLQQVLGFSAGKAGLVIAPTAFCFAALGPISGRLSDRFGWRLFAICGLALNGAAMLGLSRLTEASPLWMVMAALVMQGIGMGAFFSPNASAILSTVERARYGVATAFINMIRNAATVTGVGLTTTIVTAVMAAQGFEPSLDAVSSAPGGEGVKAAFTQGLRLAYLVMFGFVAAALALSTIRGDALAEEEEPLADTEPLTPPSPGVERSGT